IHGLTIGPRLEAALMELFNPRQSKGGGFVNPEVLTAVLRRLDELVREHGGDGRPVPVISPPGLRVGVRRLIEPVMPHVPVISLAELPSHVNLQSLATWELSDAA